MLMQIEPKTSDPIPQLRATSKPPTDCITMPESNIGFAPILSTNNPEDIFVKSPINVGIVIMNDTLKRVRLNSLRKIGIRAIFIKK